MSFCNPVTYVAGRSYDSIATENKAKSCGYRTTVLRFLSVLRQKECRGDVLNMFKIKMLSHDLFYQGMFGYIVLRLPYDMRTTVIMSYGRRRTNVR